jgi:hypothetical protein
MIRVFRVVRALYACAAVALITTPMPALSEVVEIEPTGQVAPGSSDPTLCGSDAAIGVIGAMTKRDAGMEPPQELRALAIVGDFSLTPVLSLIAAALALIGGVIGLLVHRANGQGSAMPRRKLSKVIRSIERAPVYAAAASRLAARGRHVITRGKIERVIHFDTGARIAIREAADYIVEFTLNHDQLHTIDQAPSDSPIEVRAQIATITDDKRVELIAIERVKVGHRWWRLPR